MKALVSVATVGTGRQQDAAAAAVATGLPFDGLIAAHEAATVEKRVLLAAALWSVYERAGRELPRGPEPLAPSPDETKAICAPSVAVLLRELIATPPRALLHEALGRLERRGELVPPSLLPDLLDTRDDALAIVLPAVMGERGRWLVALSGRGDWLAAPPADGAEAERIWQEGSMAQRLLALARRRDQAPDEARAWLESTWAQEAAEPRVVFLSTLQAHLSMADAPFLEAALADRSAPVRHAAARLLSRLPETETARRLTARAGALLEYAPPKGRTGLLSRLKTAVGGDAPTGTLTVTPPKAFDPAFEREGIAAKPPKGVGAGAYWLGEILALVPPAHWTARFQAAADELIRAAAATDWLHPILSGWSRAAQLHEDHEWTVALFDAWLGLEIDAALKYEAVTRSRAMELLLRAMPREAAQARVLKMMGQPATTVPFGLELLVEAVPAPWTPDYSRAVLAAMKPQAESVAAQYWSSGTWFEALAGIALRLAPETFADALAFELSDSATVSLSPAYARKLDQFREIVSLRRRIHEEIPL